MIEKQCMLIDPAIDPIGIDFAFGSLRQLVNIYLGHKCIADVEMHFI